VAETKFPWQVAWITGASGAICGEIAHDGWLKPA
jgi:hypothetical protein